MYLFIVLFPGYANTQCLCSISYKHSAIDHMIWESTTLSMNFWEPEINAPLSGNNATHDKICLKLLKGNILFTWYMMIRIA